MGIFGSKTQEGKTFVVFDIETGSVGGALAHIVPGHHPRLFGEMRIDLAVGSTRDAHTLRDKAANALTTVARHLAEVAARLRGHDAMLPVGTVHRAAAFFAAPWGTPDLVAGAPSFSEDLTTAVRSAMASTFDIPASVHARASAALGGARILLPYEHTYLIGMPGGEITEFLSVEGGAVRGYGTVPVGRHTLMRTLGTHAGLHEHEARSALRALSLGREPAHITEPLRHAHEHIGAAVGQLLQEQGWHGHNRVYTMAHDNEWFARALAGSAVAQLFPNDAVVKHLRGEHLSPYLAQHGPSPDLNLMLGALFVDSHYR